MILSYMEKTLWLNHNKKIVRTDNEFGKVVGYKINIQKSIVSIDKQQTIWKEIK